PCAATAGRRRPNPSRSGPRLLLAALLALAAARANGQSKPWSQWGQVWASSFNDWSLQIATSVPEPGSYTLRVDAAQGPVILGGPAFQPLATNAPLLLDSGANAEVATPTAVACSWAGGNCSITVTLTRAHAAPFAVRSASAGLQEAIDFVGKGSAAVILDPRWPGTDAMIAAAVGTTAIALEDERAAQRGWYSWNGSGYALALAISGVGQGTTVPQLHSSAPAITPTTIEATVYADLLGASGSAITAQGAAAAGSATLTLATVADFRNGQGIQIVHAGAPYALASPAAPAVNAVGGGGTVCKYAIAAYDGAGGESAIGAAGTVSNSSAVLDGVTAYNSIAWTAVAGARGYAIYGSCGGASPLPLVGLAPIPGYYLPFQQSRAYSVGSLVQPTASAFNGWVYQVTTSGAAAVTEPTWCTSANCTVTSGGVTFTARAMSWTDRGAPIGATGFYIPPGVASTAPPAALADALVTTVAAGGGTVHLTLAEEALADNPEAAVLHDDTAALQSALNAASAYAIVQGDSVGTSAPVVIPTGTYRISAAIEVPAYVSIAGANRPILIQTNPAAAILEFPDAYDQSVAGLSLVGGTDHIVAQNDNVDATTFSASDLDSNSSLDYAIVLLGTGASDVHMSMQATLTRVRMFEDRRLLFQAADVVNASDWWVETGADALADPNTALGYVYEGVLHFDRDVTVGIPALLGQRWFDNYDSFYAAGTRWGGENGGGIPIVYNFAGYGAAPQFLGGSGGSGSVVSITDSPITASDSTASACRCVVELAGALPNQLVLERNNSVLTPYIVALAPGFGLDAYLNQAMQAGVFDGVFEVSLSGT